LTPVVCESRVPQHAPIWQQIPNFPNAWIDTIGVKLPNGVFNGFPFLLFSPQAAFLLVCLVSLFDDPSFLRMLPGNG
jgi:hypothetical protein